MLETISLIGIKSANNHINGSNTNNGYLQLSKDPSNTKIEDNNEKKEELNVDGSNNMPGSKDAEISPELNTNQNALKKKKMKKKINSPKTKLSTFKQTKMIDDGNGNGTGNDNGQI